METTLFVWISDGLTSIINGLKGLELLMVNVFAFLQKYVKMRIFHEKTFENKKEIRNFG